MKDQTCCTISNNISKIKTTTKKKRRLRGKLVWSSTALQAEKEAFKFGQGACISFKRKIQNREHISHY